MVQNYSGVTDKPAERNNGLDLAYGFTQHRRILHKNQNTDADAGEHLMSKRRKHLCIAVSRPYW